MPGRAAFCACVLLAVLAGCSKPAAQAPPPVPVVPVAIGVAERGDAPIVLRTIGSVESPARVILRPQIAGRVSELLASEGIDVEAGRALVRLDARPYEAALREAEANLARRRALAGDARRVVQRLTGALASAAVSDREREEAESNAVVAEADVSAAEALLELARLNLEYTTVAAPFAGRLGQFAVKPGSAVKANESELVEIIQLSPIEVGFSVPESAIAGVRAALAAGTVRVLADPQDAAGEPVAGTLSFVNNLVDTQTGTLRLKATFENASLRLWPGQFVQVDIELGRDQGRVMVPDSAVIQSQAGNAVFVVKDDDTVVFLPVVTGRSVGGRTVIDKGVAAGDRVVTDGQLRLTTGSKIQTRQAAKGPA